MAKPLRSPGGWAAPLDEAVLRQAITEVLLRSAGLPTLEDAKKYLEEVQEPPEVVIEARRGSTWIREAERALQPALEKGAVRLKRVERGDWPRDKPEPRITVGGRLGGRYRFYGVPGDILQPMFLLAVAAAGRGWGNGTRCKGLDSARGTLVVYVVPGLPCARALYNLLPVVLCSHGAVLEAVNVETMVLQGMRPPVKTVPAYRTPRGVMVRGVLRSPGEALQLWSK